MTEPDDEMVAPFIGSRLRRLRKALGLSQAEICRRTGITPPTWNNYERGLHRVAIDEARKIRKVTHATLDYIYLGDMLGMPWELAEGIRKVEEEEAASEAVAKKATARKSRRRD